MVYSYAMDETLLEKAREYLALEEHPTFTDELERLIAAEDWPELNDRFYTELDFGTGGLRGVIGAGYNRMNPYMVKRATQGLATYIKKHAETPAPSVVIAHDSRRYSDLFAETVALVCCANGIGAYLFPSLRPTPELSFLVRQLGATAGIVVTASHNPPQYNGYKVYWSDGAQVVPPHDQGIIEEVRAASGHIETAGRAEAEEAGLLRTLGPEIDDAYNAMIRGHVLRPELMAEAARQTKVVYTPLHGTGTVQVERILADIGVSCITVPEQREPDAEFPTVEFPNPEEASALEMALALAAKEKADLVLGTDPDADRLGIAVPGPDGFELVTGNQLGALMCDYMLATLAELGRMPADPVIIKTIVTTELQRRVASYHGADTVDVLTGFKYIGEKIRQFEQTGRTYVFGGEESYGFLVGTEVRDKDAVSAAALAVEMTVYDRARGKTVLDHLDDLYRRHGYFQESLVSKGFAGEAGRATMDGLMERLRGDLPKRFGGLEVVECRDYRDRSVTTVDGRREEAIDLPRSNVVQYIMRGGTFTARPSGTEPKIKFYVSCWTEPGGNLQDDRATVSGRVARSCEEIEALVASV